MSASPPPETAPWALQLAARVEKLTPPATAAICAAAARATIELLADQRSAPGGEWHEPVATWNGKRIRKLVRRARASSWERVQAVPGVTAECDGAEVRAFVPSPMDQVPTAVAKLQIKSTDLDAGDPVAAVPPLPSGALVLAVTPHFPMSWGKQAAQCAHAGQRAWMTADTHTIRAWQDGGSRIVVLHPDAALWDSLDGVATTRIHDGGFTEIPPGTNSSIAWFAGTAHRRVGVCRACGYDWASAAAEVVEQLRGLPADARRVWSARDDDGRGRPSPTVWSPLEYLGHLRDSALFFRERIEKVLDEDRPTMSVGMRLGDRVEAGSYRTENPEVFLDGFGTHCEAVHQRLAGVTDAQWQRVGLGSAGQQRSVLDLARRLAHEGRHHLRDLA